MGSAGRWPAVFGVSPNTFRVTNPDRSMVFPATAPDDRRRDGDDRTRVACAPQSTESFRLQVCLKSRGVAWDSPPKNDPSRDGENVQAARTPVPLSVTKGLFKHTLIAAALCACVLGAVGCASRSVTLKPLSRDDLETSIARGVDFLVTHQNKTGSWGSARRTKELNIYAPEPDSHEAFRAAVTAMCIEALIETGAANTNAAARAALEKGEAWLLANLPNVRRSDPTCLYNIWTHAYGISALAQMYRRSASDPARQRQIKEMIEGQVKFLERFESVDGGWGYLDFKVQAQHPSTTSPCFVNATVLIALHDAREIGVAVPERLVKRAVASTQRQRKPDNTYLYSENFRWRTMHVVNRPPGSLGRSQVCNLALRLWGDKTITDAVLQEWLDRLIARNGWLSIGRKRPVPHESWFKVAGYFYYYGHYYAALCADQLDAARRRVAKDNIAAVLAPLQEKDGSWWDYPLYDYHQPYGTAFALMTLARARH
jgi:hypothetical protein